MKVRATARMSPADFTKHINARHAQNGELANLAYLDERSATGEANRATWEAYHRRLHDYREYEHEHGE